MKHAGSVVGQCISYKKQKIKYIGQFCSMRHLIAAKILDAFN